MTAIQCTGTLIVWSSVNVQRSAPSSPTLTSPIDFFSVGSVTRMTFNQHLSARTRATESIGFLRRRWLIDIVPSTSGAAMSETQRSRMHNWSEFLVVWGRNPTEQRTRPRDGVAPSEGNSDEGWWGFWRPRDITKLAQWLEATYSKTRDHEILVSKLKDYAELLKWKSKYSGHVRGKPLSSKAAGKQRAVDHETLADRKGKGNHEPYLMRSKRITAIGSSSESE
jgi:hypothetical protein